MRECFLGGVGDGGSLVIRRSAVLWPGVVVVVVAMVCASCATQDRGRDTRSETGVVSVKHVEQEARLMEIEERLDYLTSELAIQRGDLDRVREKVGMDSEEVRK